MSLILKRFLKDEEGPTAIEYAIMLSGIALLIIAGVYLLGDTVNKAFEHAEQHIGASGSSSP